MNKTKDSKSLRIRLPEALVVEARRAAPRSLKADFSSLLERALRLWLWERKEQLVDLAMIRMGKDPNVLAECRKINEEFSQCDGDGLEGL
jgi:hypothetical protein